MSAPRPFFLTGCPKSGTTWLMRLLDGLPGVACRGEGRFFSSHLRGVPTLAEALAEGLRPWHRFVAHRKLGWIGLDDEIETVERRNRVPPEVLEDSLDDIASRATAAIVRGAMERVGRVEGARWTGDKTPVLDPSELDALRRAFPEAPVIFLRRDVRDFVVSMVFHHARSVANDRPDAAMDFLDEADAERVLERERGGDGPLVSPETAERLARCWRRTGARAAALAEQGPLHRVDYEELRRDPLRILRAVAAALGEEPTEEALRAAIARAEGAALDGEVRSGEPGDWERHLDADALAAIERGAQGPMVPD